MKKSLKISIKNYPLIIVLTILLSIISITGYGTTAFQPLKFLSNNENSDAINVEFDKNDYFDLKSASKSIEMAFPISARENLILELEQIDIITNHARFLKGDKIMTSPKVVMYQGKIKNQPHSDVYISFTALGAGNGFVKTDAGEYYFLSQSSDKIGNSTESGLFIIKSNSFGGWPDYEEFCKVILPDDLDLNFDLETKGDKHWTSDAAGPQVAEVALECDQSYVQMFPDVEAAQYYAIQVMGAVSYIYTRDLNTKLMVSFLRLWPDGGEPFGADDIAHFRNWWWANENSAAYNVVHMLSGRRDLGYGGIGYMFGTCGDWAYSITAYVNGSFVTPLETPSVYNWDVNCVAHEIGHNFGGPHTHDEGYWLAEQIDSCGTGVPGRSTIMSYCHVYPGTESNISLHFHRIIGEFIKNADELEIEPRDCFWHDCNNNGEDDLRDIALEISDDNNDNGIPDECEDCNGNYILDDADIIGGMPDVNYNGVPDECEDDCNGNSIPDKYETATEMTEDMNGNWIPDECEPDCDGNGEPDVQEIILGAKDDWDHNWIPDICQDCNDNGIADMLDLEREFNFYVSDVYGNFVREYNAVSGYPMGNLGEGVLAFPCTIAFGPDRQLYVSAMATNSITRLNVDSNTVSDFIPSNSGGLDMPMFITYDDSDNLYVGSWNTDCVLRFNGTTGAFIDTFVTPASGGLQKPYGLEFGPNGNLFVAGVNDAVYEYSGTDGSFVEIFVSAGSGGLSGARGLAFAPNGDLLVAGYNSHNIYQYDGSTGAFLKIFNDIYNPTNPHGITFGPNGNLFVVQSSDDVWIREYIYPGGINTRRIVRNDPGLPDPSGIAFRPKSDNDLDGNYILDECDACIDTDGDGFGDPGHPENTCKTDNCPNIYNPDQSDWDYDGIGDTCDECALDPYNDIDNDGFCGNVDNCPTVPNDPTIDVDGDGVGDVCDNCLETPNTDQTDADADSNGDLCDNCPDASNPNQEDIDVDDVGDVCDNCPQDYNPLQEDDDENGVGNICEYVCGDADNNGTVNILDITFLIAYLYKGGPQPVSMSAADPDGNGTVNILDITYLISYLYKGGSEPVCQ